MRKNQCFLMQVGRAHDPEGSGITPWNARNCGTRHRPVYRSCPVEPDVIGFVISRDSRVGMIANVDDPVIFRPHTTIWTASIR